jgi:hypothetical protein
MKHYAGIDLSMGTLHVCVVDADGRKVGALCVDSMRRRSPRRWNAMAPSIAR